MVHQTVFPRESLKVHAVTCPSLCPVLAQGVWGRDNRVVVVLRDHQISHRVRNF